MELELHRIEVYCVVSWMGVYVYWKLNPRYKSVMPLNNAMQSSGENLQVTTPVVAISARADPTPVENSSTQKAQVVD